MIPCHDSFRALSSHFPVLSRRGLFVASYYKRKHFHKIKAIANGRKKFQTFLGFKLQVENVHLVKSQNTVHTTFLQVHLTDTTNHWQVFPALENFNIKKLHFLYQGRCCTSTVKYVCVHLFL